MKRLSIFLAALGLSAAASGAMAETTATDVRDWQTPVSYQCERGAVVDVIYLNTPGGEAYAVADIDGRLVASKIEKSASGSRYADGQEGGYVLWSQGDTLSVFYGADETPLLTDCKDAGAD